MAPPSDEQPRHLGEETGSSRERERNQQLCDNFWRKITELKELLQSARRCLVNQTEDSLENMSRELRKMKRELCYAYEDLREKFSITQEVRLSYDRCQEETDGTLTEIIKALICDRPTKNTFDTQSRTSLTSSKRFELQARATALEVEKKAKYKEERLQSEINQLEAEEAI